MIASLLLAGLLLAGSPAFAGDGFGNVAFANSGAVEAQTDFLEGLALLHDFEYAAAAAAFRRAQEIDPGFAMAYWGEALTSNHPIWMQQNLDQARAALDHLAPNAVERRAKALTEREKEYLDTVEILYGEGSKEARDFLYEQALARLHERYPDDVDGTALYGLAILGTAHAGRDVPTYMRAAGVLEEAWPDHREHPGLLHYLIHSFDDPTHAPLGLRAARRYARIAPDAAHAQHMTSHIFLALGMWPETIAANIAAIADVNRARQLAGKAPLGCGHYPSWLGYAYLQTGELDLAKAALETCRSALESEVASEAPGHSMDPDDSLSGSFADMRLRYLVDGGDALSDLANWPLPESAGVGARLDTGFGKILRELRHGQPAAARQALRAFEELAREATERESERGNPDPTYRIRPEILLLEARALLAEREGDLADAETQLRRAVELEEALPTAFGPPAITKPSRELLAEFLLRHERRDEAHAEFARALASTPGRRAALRGFEASSPTARAAP